MESAENQDRSPKTDPSEELQDSKSLSISKVETIKLLNDSIDRLEQTIEEISQNSAEKLPSSDSIESLVNTTQELADSVSTPPEATVEVNTAEEKTEATATITPAESTVIETNPIPPAEIKSKPSTDIPPKKNPVKKQKRANKSLIAIGVTAIAIALLALAWLRYPQIKAAVSPTPKTTEIVSQNEDQGDWALKSAPEINKLPVVNSDKAIENVEIQNSVDAPQVSQTESETPIVIPQDLVSPGRAKNLKIETIEPELTFTPEQTLVAALQSKLVQEIADYDSEIFDRVLVDVPETSLLVKVTDSWYKLSESRQAKLANDILKRSRQLNFSKLQLQDSTGTLVARNPVVGDRIIIVRAGKDN